MLGQLSRSSLRGKGAGAGGIVVTAGLCASLSWGAAESENHLALCVWWPLQGVGRRPSTDRVRAGQKDREPRMDAFELNRNVPRRGSAAWCSCPGPWQTRSAMSEPFISAASICTGEGIQVCGVSLDPSCASCQRPLLSSLSGPYSRPCSWRPGSTIENENSKMR